MAPTPKFKQIMTCGDNQWAVYALSEDGGVYRWTVTATLSYWVKLENSDSAVVR